MSMMGGGKKLSELIHSFAEQDERVVAVDKENGGVSSARNRGIEMARGEWLVFVDPDDRVEPYFLERLLSTVEGTDNVLGVGGFKQTYLGQGREVDYTLDRFDKHTTFAKEFPKWRAFLYGAVWNKIFKTSFIKTNNITFPAFSMREDTLFLFRVYELLDNIGVVEDCGYRYLMYGSTASQAYHAKYSEMMKLHNQHYYSLLKRCGVEDVEETEIMMVANDIYCIVINAFNRNTPLSFAQKTAYIQELMDDGYWMGRLEKHDISRDKRIVKLTARLMLTRKAWLVAWTFRVLFALKNNFRGLYFWYDAHLSGKFS